MRQSEARAPVVDPEETAVSSDSSVEVFRSTEADLIKRVEIRIVGGNIRINAVKTETVTVRALGDTATLVMDQPGKRMNAGGTRSASQTPLALRRNACPASCIAPASTARTTGAPRRAPTRVAVSRSGDRWT